MLKGFDCLYTKPTNIRKDVEITKKKIFSKIMLRFVAEVMSNIKYKREDSIAVKLEVRT